MPRTRVGDVELHYVEEGRGRPVLLVHGFPLDHSMWRAQTAALSRTARVIAPDLRGFGQSTVSPGTVTMSQYADDLAGFLDAIGVRERIVFCGLSMGGYIAWQFWKRHADRLAGMILCDTRAAADTAEAAEARLKSAEQVEQAGLDSLVKAMTEKLFAPTTAAEQPDIVEETRRVMLNSSRQGIAAALRGMAERVDMTSELPKMRLPTLIICGEHDVIAKPDEMRGISQALPESRFVDVSSAGHMSPLEKPSAFNEECKKFLLALR